MGYAGEMIHLLSSHAFADIYQQTTLSATHPNATIAPVILASDKTQLSILSGDNSAWPVYLTIGNLPKSIRRQTNQCACLLIAYLPIAKLLCFSNETAWYGPQIGTK